VARSAEPALHTWQVPEDELAPLRRAGLHPPGTEDVTATMSGALSRTGSNLMSHVEQCDRDSRSIGPGPAEVGLQRNRPGRVGSRIRQALEHTFVAAKGQPAGEYHRVDAFLSSDRDLCGLAGASLLLSRRNCKAAVCT
jgi:hypothetical protein